MLPVGWKKKKKKKKKKPESSRDLKIFISLIEDFFNISGRGYVVVPGIPYSTPCALKIGDQLLLVRPDGVERTAILRGMEMGSRNSWTSIPILFDKSENDHIVKGTEIWFFDDSPAET